MDILLIEDSAAEARFLHEILKATIPLQFHLDHVKRLGDGVNCLTQNHFNVVLLDLTLPDSQGLISIDTLTSVAPQLPIVVLTNTNDNELALEAVRQGAQDYLVKRQVNGELLVRSLRYAIERKQASEALREANEALEVRVQERTAELETTNELLKQEISSHRQAQERLELAQKAAQIGTFEWNIRSNEVTWSAELESLYGLSPGSFAGQYEQWAKTLHPGDRTKTEQEFWHAVHTGEGLNTEFRIVHPDGTVHWIAAKSKVFCDETDIPLRMLGVHIDITEKKQFEAQFLQAQRLESLGTLASGIAHDLNNILTPILTIAQLLSLKLQNLDERNRQMLTMLNTSAKRGADLVKQILSFARGVEGKRISLQMGSLISEIKKILQETLCNKSIDIQTDIATDLWLVSADITQLHQVLMNLCVNARDAMPTGGILSLGVRNLWVDEQQARRYLEAKPGPYVVSTVKDTGVGIAPEIINRIFDPFFTTKDIGQGTGLGLSAVLGIIKSHGGFVEVQSQVGNGSQFQIYLPAIEAMTAQVSVDWELLSGQQELILVVDDETAICDMTKLALESYNYRVLVAHNGTEAIALCSQYPDQIDGVLLDIMMPSLNGIDTIPILQKLNPYIPIIAMSGLASTETVAQIEQLGVQRFLAKPFTTRELLQTIHEVKASHCYL
ncbi:response regulator [Oscillatoria sp. FACHB-1407]|uniref:ATP-binding response regulator n=1 Tax=Oscillatoria sp. FACHB-1407 TaxID=2692847 RepID=UPI00168293B2|nr:response regulator [Oscillatoria sp. FACHB-1407]MBD2460593.1 response regulator [Oscillatoria sp. FACHB-1407]